MNNTDVFLTPASRGQGKDDSRAYQHLINTVVNGIDRSHYSKFTSKDLGERIAIWGMTDGNKSRWDQIDEGDYLLYYIGDETYRYTAKVIGKEENLELANDLWPDFADDAQGGVQTTDPWRWVIYLDKPFRVDIDSSELHGFAGHDINYIMGFMRLNDKGKKALIDQFGSVEAYLAERATNKNTFSDKGSSTKPQPEARPSNLSNFQNDCSASSDTAPFYWVNQTQNPEEIENEYLQAPANDHWYHDVGKLENGDRVFNYTNGQIIGYSTVVDPAKGITESGEEYCRVEVKLHRFDEPLNFADIFSYLSQEEVQVEKYSPVNQGGINQQYLFNLSEAAGEYLLKKGESEKGSTDHQLLTHYTTTPAATVWMYSSGPTDWLTILRRGALQFWEKIKSQWQQVNVGDIVLFHMKRSDDGNKALPEYHLDESGFIGYGVVGNKRTKTERWWWNEHDRLAYPYLANLTECNVTCDVEELDRSRALFQLDKEEIKSEIKVLEKGLIPWQQVKQISQETTDKDLPGPGGVANISAHRSGIQSFLEQYIAVSNNGLRRIEFESSEQLPAMLPAVDKPVMIDGVERQLTNTGQIVFHGPPGTGKTYTATRFAKWWINQQTPRPVDTRLRMVTFHPSFAYEDFMEGLAADTTSTGQVTYGYEPGVFKKIYRDAKDAYEATDPDETAPRYILIIDEINRGNLSQIFGEIITQLEMDKRLGQEEQVTLEWAHSGESVIVPPNLFLIGTMNTADRSIALIDAALRRRFSFHNFPPNTDVIIQEYDQFDSRAEIEDFSEDMKLRFDTLLARSVRAVEAVNQNIVSQSDLTRGKRIGHSYLLGLDNIQEIVDAWKFNILPLLEEYYFGDFTRLRREVFNDERDDTGPAIITSNLFELSTGEVAEFTSDDLYRALDDLIQRHDFSQYES